MTRVTIADLWEDSRAFVRREAGLLLPMAFATIGLATVLLDLAMPAGGAGLRPQPGAWMIALPPVAALLLVGNLAVTALALQPGISVREAFQVALARLPRAAGAALLVLAGLTVLFLAAGVVAAAIGAAARWSPVQTASLLMMIALPVVVWAGVRLLTLWPVVVERPGASPLSALRIAFAETRGRFSRLFGAVLLFGLGYMLILTAVQIGLGSVLTLVGRATGHVAAAALVLGIVTALLGAALQAVWTVFVAVLYRRLGPSSSGI